MKNKTPSLSRRQVLQVGAAASLAASVSPPLAWAATPPPAPAALSSAKLAESPNDAFALSRLAYGPRKKDLQAWQLMAGHPDKRLAQWLEHQLKPRSIDDKLCDQRIAQAGFTTLGKSMSQLWKDHVIAPEQMPEQIKSESAKLVKDPAVAAKQRDERLQPASETEEATWIRAVYSERQLQEVMVSFWHNHFNVYAWEQKIAASFVHYDRDVIRKHAFGNFREMLEAVAQSPAMLLYLDNGINQSGNPNENYARELFELHTLGAENYLGTRDRASVLRVDGQPQGYVDGDVYEAARSFTGWRLDQGGNSDNTGVFEYFDQWHDRFQKVVLGKNLKEYQPPMQDGRDVLDLLASHPGTARYVSRKLCRRLVSDEPAEALVAKVAHVFHEQRQAPDQMQHVLKAIVLSDDFKQSAGRKMVEPFAATVSFLRAIDADFTPSDPFLKNFETTGRRLFAWRTPDGYPDRGERWFGTNVVFERWRLMTQILVGSIKGVNIANAKVENFTGEFTSHLEHELLLRELSPSTRTTIARFLERNKKRPRRFLFATGMAFMAPEIQLT